MIPSNLTLDEVLKFYDLPQPVLDAIERERHDCHTAVEEAENQRTESLREQIFFAQELIDGIEQAADDHTVMKKFREKLRVLLDDTSFER